MHMLDEIADFLNDHVLANTSPLDPTTRAKAKNFVFWLRDEASKDRARPWCDEDEED